MAETVRSELPNLWRSMNEPGACRYLYHTCPKLKAGSRASHGMRSSTDVSEWGRPRDFRLWHVRDVTPAATRAAAIRVQRTYQRAARSCFAQDVVHSEYFRVVTP